MTIRALTALVALASLGACAGERPPMNPDNPGADARPMQREVYQMTFPPGGTPAQGLPAATPSSQIPPNAPIRQPGNRP